MIVDENRDAFEAREWKVSVSTKYCIVFCERKRDASPYLDSVRYEVQRLNVSFHSLPCRQAGSTSRIYGTTER